MVGTMIPAAEGHFWTFWTFLVCVFAFRCVGRGSSGGLVLGVRFVVRGGVGGGGGGAVGVVGIVL